MPYLQVQRTQILTLDLDGEIIQKNEKQVQFTSEQATTEKVQREYKNICLNNKKKLNFR